VWSYVNKRLAAALRAELEAAVKANDSRPSEEYSPDAKSAARRDLKNKALGLLATLGDPQITAECLQRCRNASGCPPCCPAAAVVAGPVRCLVVLACMFVPLFVIPRIIMQQQSALLVYWAALAVICSKSVHRACERGGGAGAAWAGPTNHRLAGTGQGRCVT
jgi:hypothetical protein